MKAYRRCWTGASAAGGLLGIVVAFLAWPLAAVATLFASVAVVSGCVATGRARASEPAEQVERWPERMRARVRFGVLAGAAAVSLTGLAILLHGWALPLALVMSVGSPAVLVWLRRRYTQELRHDSEGSARRTHELGEAESSDMQSRPPGVRSMSTAQLCEAWCASYLALQSARTPEDWMRVVTEREAYLDEFERRDPAGLNAWLSSGARVASNPAHCFSSRHRRHHS